MESEKIRIYKLIDVADILKNEQLIKRIFYDVLKVPKNSNGHEFSISPISGWINYANNNELFSTTRKKTLLPNESSDAEKNVKQFIAKVKKEFSSNQFYKKTGLPLPFNNSIYFIESTLVFEKTNYPNIDHWLVKFGFKLSNGFDSSDVFGASLEVRIGNNANKDFSQIIGFSLKWTPTKNSVEDDKIAFVHEHEVGHKDAEEKPIIMYKLDGESFPQNFLAPFYITPNGHHLEFTPASKKHSIIAKIFEVENENGKELFPNINGGSGDFIYQWAIWEQANYNSSVTIIDADSIKVSIGVFNVALNVIDRKTTVVTQTQSTVYALGKEENRYKPVFTAIEKGCMHPLATNYKAIANVDDGSCLFPVT